jgi:hypothetical protein
MSVAVVTALALAVGFRLPVAQLGPPSIVQPETYLSPSGRLELVVDPHERRGRGPAALRLLRDGTLVWERECDVTLVDARLFEDGSVVGYAYPGDLALLFLAPDGGERARVVVERKTRLVHGAPQPDVLALDVRSAPDSVTFRLSDGRERHFSIGGLELVQPPPGRPAEAGLLRKPAHLLPPPERPLELVELARVALLFTPTRTSMQVPLARLSPRTGTLTIHEGSNGVLHVFGADGRRQRLCLPAPGDPVNFRPYDQIDVDPEGNLHAYNSKGRLSFGPQGERLGFVPLDVPLGQGAQYFSLPSGARWRIELDRLTLERSGEADLVVERSAEGRWFLCLQSAAVSPDGVLSIVDDGYGIRANHTDTTILLQVFDPDGRARASLPLSGFSHLPLAAKRGECSALNETSRELLVLATDGSHSGRAPLPQAITSLGPITYSPDGSELWLVDHDFVLHRFELRWK